MCVSAIQPCFEVWLLQEITLSIYSDCLTSAISRSYTFIAGVGFVKAGAIRETNPSCHENVSFLDT